MELTLKIIRRNLVLLRDVLASWWRWRAASSRRHRPRADAGRERGSRRDGRRSDRKTKRKSMSPNRRRKRRADERNGWPSDTTTTRLRTPLSARRARVHARHNARDTRAAIEHRAHRRRTTVYSRARSARALRIIALSRHDFRVTNARPGCTRTTDDAPSRRHFALCASPPEARRKRPSG